MRAAPEAEPTRLLWGVGCVSAALLGFEIALMRLLLVTSWHHFAFLVISLALLGLGASGTALFLARTWVMARAGRVLWGLVVATALAMPLCVTVAQHVPVEARIVPALLWRQIACWTGYWAVLSLPFFLGGAVVGLALMTARRRIAGVYAANLAGSAAGAILATVGMRVIAPEWLAAATGGLALIGATCLSRERALMRLGGCTLCGLVVAAGLWLWPPRLRPDPDKYSAYVQRLVQQGSARRVSRALGPRALLEAYEGEVFHDLPFLALGEPPPPMLSLTMDGHLAGAVLRIEDPSQAEVMDRTLMALPYCVAPERPRVLLLGERCGANVWLAVRRAASEIAVVQPDATLVRMLRGPLRDMGGAALDRRGVRVVVAEPRHFVEHTARQFDVIQLVTLEGSAAGSGGIGGLAQDHLSTVEGVSACLERLRDDGVLFVCRGIQTPPRDNVKLLATFIEALRLRGVTYPERHLLVVRDYLGVCTAARRSPWQAAHIARIRQVCADRELTPVWFPGIEPAELNQPDALPEAPDGVGDWYHYAARQLFSPAADAFLDDWPFAVRPATDDRPFFLDFCKLGALGKIKRGFGDMWLTRAELAFPFVIGAALLVGLVGVALTLLPLALRRSAGKHARRWPVAGYFGAIGLAYMLLEMTFLSRLTYLIGDPVQAAALTISTFLLASGLGSLTVQRASRRVERYWWVAIAALLAIGIVELQSLPALARAAGAWSLAARCLTAVLIVAPLAYFMGFPMPTALGRLHRGAAMLIPWAWGVNGFASVLAAPLATIVGMTWGFGAAGVGALALYLTAAGLFRMLPGKA